MTEDVGLATSKCRNCGGDLITRSRTRLLVTGIAFCAVLAFTPLIPWLWLPAIFFGLAGAYLVAWATRGKGHWCRQCKSFQV